MTRCVRVVTENAAIDRAFEYEVTPTVSQVGVGDRVRVNFNNRSLRGWVTGDAEVTRDLKAIEKWLGLGPPPEMIPLLEWAARRWFAPLSRFLLAASPGVIVRELPVAPALVALDHDVAAQTVAIEPGVVLASPSDDPLGLVLYAHQSTLARSGSLLVLVPTEAWAQRLRGRLEQRGLAVAQGDARWDQMRAGWPVIIGARGSALAPAPRLRAVVLIDADDEAFRSESSPTWDATTMLLERCRRDDAPWWFTSVAPSPTLLALGPVRPWGDVPHGWPRIDVVDRREVDPHDGVLTRHTLEAAHRALEGAEPVAVVVILQRLGHGRLLACRRCGELARCAQCHQAEVEVDDELACADQHERRARFCRSCGSTNLKKVRVGVSSLARDVALQLSVGVDEVTAATTTEIGSRVVVGTEAVFSRVRRCSLVVFVDFDQYLLAPRESARRHALGAVAKAGRLVGSRREGRGSVVVQTRRHDEVIDALVSGDVEAVVRDDATTAELLGLPPYGARAVVSGEAAQEFVGLINADVVQVRRVGDTWVLATTEVDVLTTELRAVSRPPGRLRVEVF